MATINQVHEAIRAMAQEREDKGLSSFSIRPATLRESTGLSQEQLIEQLVRLEQQFGITLLRGNQTIVSVGIPGGSPILD